MTSFTVTLARSLPILALAALGSPTHASTQRMTLAAPLYMTAPVGQGQATIDRALRDYDTAGQPITITLGAGTHGPLHIWGAPLGGGWLILNGSTGGTTILGTNATAILATNTRVIVRDMRLMTTGTPAAALSVAHYTQAYLQGAMTLDAASAEHVMIQNHSVVYLLSPDVFVTGSAQSFVHVVGSSSVTIHSRIHWSPWVSYTAYIFGAGHSEIGWHGGYANGIIPPAPTTCAIHTNTTLYASAPLPGSCVPSDITSIVK